MKKVLIAVLIVLAFVLMFNANTYKMKGEVIANGVIEDECGHLWEVDTNDFKIGDEILIVFQEKGNENRRTDDIVKELKEI